MIHMHALFHRHHHQQHHHHAPEHGGAPDEIYRIGFFFVLFSLIFLDIP